MSGIENGASEPEVNPWDVPHDQQIDPTPKRSRLGNAAVIAGVDGSLLLIGGAAASAIEGWPQGLPWQAKAVGAAVGAVSFVITAGSEIKHGDKRGAEYWAKEPTEDEDDIEDDAALSDRDRNILLAKRQSKANKAAHNTDVESPADVDTTPLIS